MSYGGAIRVPTRPDPPPDLRVLRHEPGEGPDLVDRLLDLQYEIGRHGARRATGEEIPLIEQLRLEREKIDVLREVRDRGNDVQLVRAALGLAELAASELERRVARGD